VPEECDDLHPRRLTGPLWQHECQGLPQVAGRPQQRLPLPRYRSTTSVQHKYMKSRSGTSGAAPGPHILSSAGDAPERTWAWWPAHVQLSLMLSRAKICIMTSSLRSVMTGHRRLHCRLLARAFFGGMTILGSACQPSVSAMQPVAVADAS